MTVPISWSTVSTGLAAASLAAASLLAGCERGRSAEAPAAPAAPAPAVVVAEVIRRSVPVVRDFVARTEGVPTVEIRARVQGILERVEFQEGFEVRKGQVLFVIQPDEYRAALRSARAHLTRAEADLTRARDVSVVARAEAALRQAQADLSRARQDVARYRPLVEARALPTQDLDTALSREEVAAAAVEAAQAALQDTRLNQRTQIQLGEAAVEAARAGVTQAELQLEYTTVRSPITGVIGKIQVDPGNLVGKGEPTLLATVSAVDPIFVDFSITDAELLHFHQRLRATARDRGRGQPPRDRLELTLSDGTVFPSKGHPVFMDRAVDARTGTIAVRAEFPNPEKILRPGQFGRVRATVEVLPDAVLVPQLAIQELQGNTAVLVVGEGDRVAARTVSLGERYQQFTVVTRGLEGGERVIIEGAQRVQPGMQVAPELQAIALPAPVAVPAVPAGGPPAPAPPRPAGGGNRSAR